MAENPLLEAPELGPVADTVALYEAVEKTSPLPVGKSTVMMVLLPIVLPMLLVVAQRVPIRDVLAKLLKTVI